jgi:hypothetical protein
MARIVRNTLGGLTGAAIGYFALCIAANLENWQFYTLRSFVTGRTAMSQIVADPADRWVTPVLLVLFVSGAAVAGALFTRCLRRDR